MHYNKAILLRTVVQCSISHQAVGGRGGKGGVVQLVYQLRKDRVTRSEVHSLCLLPSQKGRSGEGVGGVGDELDLGLIESKC